MASENFINSGPNGTVNSIIADGAAGAYVGGDFTAWGYQTGGLASINSSNAAPDLEFPDVVGTVEAIAPDGAGGYFIGGLFDEVGGEERENLAHINATGNVTDWAPETYGDSGDPNSDGMVFILEVHDGVVFAGGRFLEVWDQAADDYRTQPLGAAFDASTAQVLDWNPGFNLSASGWFNLVNFAVWDFHVLGTTLYVGGSFNELTSPSPDVTRSGIASFDLSSINTAPSFGLTTWAPNPDGPVLTMTTSPGGDLLIGGIFENVGATPLARKSLAEINVMDGAVMPFDVPITTVDAPNTFPGQVEAIAVSGSDISIGGWFDEVGGLGRENLAQVSSIGVVDPWNPAPDGGVEAITSSEGNLYVAGWFSEIDGETQEGIARFDSLGNLSAWDPGLDDSASALSPIADGILIGGGFSLVDSTPVRQLVRITSSGGVDNTFVADSSMVAVAYGVEVTALAMWSGELAVARTGFDRTTDDQLNTLEWIDPNNGAATTRLPFVPNGIISSLVAGSRLYAGGDFTSVDPPGGGPVAARTYGFAVLSDGESLAAWAPAFAGIVNQLHDDGSFIYAVGEGPQTGLYIGGTPFAVRAARLEDGLIDNTWSVDFSQSGTAVYGQALSVSTWAGEVVIGGRMLTSTSAGDDGLSLLGVSPTDASIAWQSSMNGRSRVIAQAPRENSLIIGGAGSLNTANTSAQPFRLAILDLPIPPTTRSTWLPVSPGNVNAAVISGSNLFVGGSSGLLITPLPTDDPNSGGGEGGGGSGGGTAETQSVTTSTSETITSTQLLGPDTTLTLRPGEVAIVSNGTRFPALGTPRAGNRSLIVTGVGMSLTVPSPTGLGGSGAPSWEPGQVANLNTAGFDPGTVINAYLLSTPTLVGSSNAIQPNNFAVSVPKTFKTGAHTLQVVGKDAQGRALIIAVGLTIDKTPQSVGSSVYFKLNSAQLTKSAKATLRSMVKQVRAHSSSNPSARVVGIVRANGTRASDIRLAKERARSVSQYMRAIGYKGTLRASTARVSSTDRWTDRRVNVSVTWSR